MDHGEIYARHAERYDALVQAEDCDGALIPAIDAITAGVETLSGAAVLEVGVGTGRIARAIVRRVGRLVAVDREAAMLDVARRHLTAIADAAPWELHHADARSLPVPSGWADIAIAGWVFGHLRTWFPDDWAYEIAIGLGEMRRALRPGGVLIVIETLGTGSEVPAAPTPELGEYYRFLEGVERLKRRTIRTDYQFPDVETAATTTGFFFGDAFAARVRREGWSRVPECTGLWWKRTPYRKRALKKKGRSL